jgi:glycosyltransferase involved in cell wall biosynthesis
MEWLSAKGKRVIKVLIINEERIPHYRIEVYNYLSEYLKKDNTILTVASGGIQEGDSHRIKFNYKEISLTFLSVLRLIIKIDPDAIIFWVRLKNPYLFPILIITKALRKGEIYWGHGYDLYGKNAKYKKIANNIQYWMSDALILYGEHLKKYVNKQFHDKIFIANNTLYFNDYDNKSLNKKACLSKYNIITTRNIICMGRMQKRKRLEDLFEAFKLIDLKDVGLILVGPDTDGILREVNSDNIYKLGPIYGNERLDLLSAADVFCLPGAVGLSIVDAFYCGLPFVTEDGTESPEIMYLKEGVNGFIVPKGNVQQLAAKLQLLLEDDELRAEFSQAAKNEIMTNGHIDNMCKGFSEALKFVCSKHSGRVESIR